MSNTGVFGLSSFRYSSFVRQEFLDFLSLILEIVVRIGFFPPRFDFRRETKLVQITRSIAMIMSFDGFGFCFMVYLDDSVLKWL